MKLWILRPIEQDETTNDPWIPWYNTAHGFVIRAQCEGAARSIAAANAGDERRNVESVGNPWLLPEYSACEELTVFGPDELIMVDFSAG